MTKPPKNLLIIISDEHRKDAMGCTGHPLVQTPNLDALAACGTRFTNAYTPSPMCVPTRAALACGEPVHAIGHWDSASPYDGKRRSWMHEMRDAGHEVTSIGKLHFRSTDDDNGFTREILPMHVVGDGWMDALLRENPRPYDTAYELAAQVGEGDSTYTDYDRAITAATVDWLGEKKGSDEPWVGFISLVSPHYPLTCPAEYRRLYRAEDMDWPLVADQKPDHPEMQRLLNFFDYGSHFDAASIREAKMSYYGLISFMDACVGQILSALDDSGQAEDTAVLYISDHGDMMGDQGIWTKQVMYDQSAGVPMILAGAGVPAGKTVSTAVSLLDVAATATSVAGLPVDAKPGQSLFTLATRDDDPDRTVLSEYHDGGSTTGTFMVRWGQWKYVYYVGEAPQLFDLITDPNELTNRAIAPDADAALALEEGERRLRALCDPEAVSAQAFADQRARVQALGGEDAVRNAFIFNHTPTPVEQAKMRD